MLNSCWISLFQQHQKEFLADCKQWLFIAFAVLILCLLPFFLLTFCFYELPHQIILIHILIWHIFCTSNEPPDKTLLIYLDRHSEHSLVAGFKCWCKIHKNNTVTCHFSVMMFKWTEVINLLGSEYVMWKDQSLLLTCWSIIVLAATGYLELRNHFSFHFDDLPLVWAQTAAALKLIDMTVP